MSSLLYDTHMHRSLHSNLVIFKYMTPGAELKSVTTLHSNLVIFKFIFLPLYLMPAPFTFQPGYIQMYVLTPVKVLENLFTFQPGYIQILTGKLIRLALEIFTFQPGYIQMSELATLEDVEKILYIPTWLYSNLDYCSSSGTVEPALHSNLVIFKSESYNTIYSRHFKPHFLSTRIFTSTELLWRVYFITIKYPFTFIL